MPLLCNYYLTYRCNARCDFCCFGDHAALSGGAPAATAPAATAPAATAPAATAPAASAHAVTSDVLRNLPQLRRLGVRFVDFTGGEPLLHPDLPAILREARRQRIATSITSNGLLYPKRAAELRGLVDLLHFSLDAADAAAHDRSRGVPCFEAVMESLRIAVAQGDHPDLLFTATEENHGDLERVWEWTRPRKLLLLVNPIFSHVNEFRLSSEALAHLEKFSRRPFVYLNPAFLALRRQGGNNIAKPLCKAVSRVVVISPENELLLPCYHFHSEKIPIGGDLAAAHRSERVDWHRRRQGRHEFCRGCAINCYFEPSFAWPLNRLSLAAAPSKFRYGWYKYLRRYW